MTFPVKCASQPGPLLFLLAVRLSATGRFRSLTGLLACLTALASISVLLASCGGGGRTPPPPPPVTYISKSGLAQKGPLIKGSTVTAQELDAKLSPTGKQYSYQITSDLGAFSPTSTFGSQYIGVNATGYYFDEVQNAVSGGPITLNGYSDLATNTVLNVNLLTTLAYQRIQNLVVGSKLTFAAARTQAENEVLTALNIPTGSYGPFATLDLSGGTDGDHILAAMSSLFVYGNASGPLNALMASVQSDIDANGKLTVAATKATLAAAAKALNPAVVAANLTQRYSAAGVAFSAADLAAWIDQDGDGVVGKFKFQVADATPASSFTLPAFVVSQIAGSSVSVTAGRMSVNGTVATGAVPVASGDVVAVSPNVGPFPNGVLTSYILSGATRVARVSFVSNLLSITVTPEAISAPKGVTQQFKAMGNFSDGSTADLSGIATWTSSQTSVATVNAATGLAQAAGLGMAMITASSGSVFGSATLTVTPAVLQSIAITPNPAYTAIGVNTQLAASGTYSDATTSDVTKSATWATTTPSIATVVPTTGVLTGVAVGSTIVSATFGQFSDSVSASVTTDRWYSAGSLASSERCYHTATLLPSGKVLVTGGFCSGTVTATAELYDPATNAWTAAHNMTSPRYRHTATLLGNGKVLVTGGMSTVTVVSTLLSSAELYDPATDTWSAVNSMSTARWMHTATLISDGRVLVVGGNDASGVSARSELYDPSSGNWSAAGNLIHARSEHTASLLPNGRVLVTGGETLVTNTADSSVEIYDPMTNMWSAGPAMSSPRLRHTATVLKDGRVLVAAGFNGAPNLMHDTATTEIYDAATNQWITAASLTTERDAHTATLLPDGTVLVAGGANMPPQWLASAERYDPTTNTWSSAGTLATARAFHTATLLQTGAVLVTGGYGGTTWQGTTSSELY